MARRKKWTLRSPATGTDHLAKGDVPLAKAASAEAHPRVRGEREQRRPRARIQTPATGDSVGRSKLATSRRRRRSFSRLGDSVSLPGRARSEGVGEGCGRPEGPTGREERRGFGQERDRGRRATGEAITRAARGESHLRGGRSSWRDGSGGMREWVDRPRGIARRRSADGRQGVQGMGRSWSTVEDRVFPDRPTVARNG